MLVCVCVSLSLFLDLSGISQLTAHGVTDTSVTLFWTPPHIQYETYHITFTSQVKKKNNKQAKEREIRRETKLKFPIMYITMVVIT